MYRAVEVAAYLIMLYNKSRISISNLKLQKLLYFIQGAFLAERGTACFSDAIEAWNFGPVVPAVYHKYKVYGSGNIPPSTRHEEIPFSEEEKNLINAVCQQYASYSATDLVKETHGQAPWRNAYRSYRNAEITESSMMKFFTEQKRQREKGQKEEAE